jgi:SAM-dependent methyltransferase
VSIGAVSSSADRHHAKVAYQAWASFYDADYAHVQFHRIGRVFHELALRHGAPGRRMLDLGCGTGTNTLEFASLGYQVTGCDIAPAMLEIAQNKPGADRVRFVQADLRDLPDLGSFDVAVSTTDPISHLLTDQDLAAALHGAARSLVPGGVLVFDQRAEPAYRRLSGQTIVTEQDDQLMMWRVTEKITSEKGAVFGMQIDRFVKTGNTQWQRLTHQHFLRYRDEPLIRQLLKETGLECLVVHSLRDDGLLRMKPDEQADTTIIYVARRPERSGHMTIPAGPASRRK